MEDISRISKNDGSRLRMQNRSVVHKANLSTTYTKKSLRANNRALARALSRKKQELSVLNNNYVKLLGETNLLRLHLQGCDMEMSKFYAEKFTQFKNTVSSAAKLLHNVCGQLIDISANFEHASEFFQNLQSISLSKPNALTQNVTVVRRPAQRVAVNQTNDSSDIDDNIDEVKKDCNAERCLEVIEEETSHITCTEFNESTVCEGDDDKENEIIVQNSINDSFNINSSVISTDEVSPIKMNISPVPCKSAIQTFHQLEECSQAVEGQNLKHKISACKKKSSVSKPGHMKYNAAKPTTESSDKLKFKSLSVPKSSDDITTAETLDDVPKCSNINPVKDKQMAVYDISLDDSSYVAPPVNQLRKGQISQDHPSHQVKQAPKLAPEVICDEEPMKSVECLNEPRGIMLRLGNGSRTKPKDKSKSVRYSEDVTSTASLDAAPTSPSKVLDIREEQSQVECEAPILEVSRSEHEKVKGPEGESAPFSDFEQLKSNENKVSNEVNERKSVSEKNFHLKDQQDIKTEIPDLMDSLDSRSSDGNPRKRRAASNVNYKEPSLNSKLRKGDPHTFTLYDNHAKKRGKKSAS